MLFPVKPWAIARLARRPSKSFLDDLKCGCFDLRESNPHRLDPCALTVCAFRYPPVTEAVPLPLSFPDLWVHLTFLLSSNHDQFVGTFFLLRAMTIYSTSWFVGNVYRLFAKMYAALRMFYGFFVRLCMAFAYQYGLFVHLCTAFAHVVWLLQMYTAYILRKLCGFCVHIRIFVRVERILIRWKYWWYDLEGSLICLKSWWSNIEGSLICWNSWLSNLWFAISVWKIMMIGPSGGSDIQGSVKFFIRQYTRYYWTIWRILSSGFCRVIYTTICTQFTVRSYLIKFLSENILAIHRTILPQRYLVDIDRAIYLSWWSNITVQYSAL